MLKPLLLASFVSSLLVSARAQSVASPCLPAGTLALWRADGDAGDAVGMHDGTLKNGATFGNGVAGQAFAFDGLDDYVEVPDDPAWDFSAADFSIELWVTMVDTTSPYGLVGQSDGPGFQRKWILHRNYNGSDNLTFHMNFPAADLQVAWTPNANTWHHIAFVRQGSTCTFYADGGLLGQVAFAGPLPNPAAPLRIGENGEGGWRLNGAIDDAAIYDRALAASEIASLFVQRGLRCPSAWASLGLGCASQVGIPVLTGFQLPRLGGLYEVQLAPLPPFTPLILFTGASSHSWQGASLPLDLTPLGMTSCTLYCSLDIDTQLSSGPSGSVRWGFGIPQSPSLLGAEFFNQALVLAPGANPLGVVASNAGKATIGL